MLLWIPAFAGMTSLSFQSILYVIPMKIGIQILEVNMTCPIYALTLHKTYYRKGFFNLGVSVDRYIQPSDGPVTIYLGDSTRKLCGRSNRKAQTNRTPRIHGNVPLAHWFMKNFEELDVIDVVILSPNELNLRKKTP